MRVAADGLRVRPSRIWTNEKLGYVERYATAFMRAMYPRRVPKKWSTLAYVDLLAGPGMCADRITGEEYPGSAIRALRVEPSFDHYYFADVKKSNIKALKARIPKELRNRVSCCVGDCNILAHDVVRRISGGTLCLAFLDPEGFEVRFETLRILATKPVDVIYLFPSGIGIRRNLGSFVRMKHSPMDDLWGGPSWRDLPLAKLAAGRTVTMEELAAADRSWVTSFRARVENLGYVCQDEGDPVLFNERNVPMYHLLFFSKHLAGLTLWREIKKITPSGQRQIQFPG